MKPKSASKLSCKNGILLALIALVLCASPAIALADSCIGQTNWSVPSGNWFDQSNWSNDVPNGVTSAQINNGGTATIGSTGAVSCDLTRGGSATDSGTLVVDHGGLQISFDAAVGGYGKGTLSIKNGGTVTAALAGIAEVAGSNGAATVDGTNSQWTLSGALDVGGAGTSGGTGLLTVTNDGRVSAGNVHVWKSGTFTGNGTATTTSGTTIEDTLTPSGGTLTIGGDLTFTGSSPLMECNVVPASADNVSVSGVASLAGKISVTMTGTTFRAGTTYTLLHAAGGFAPEHRQFQFVSIKGGSGDCFTPVITYDTNNNNVNLYLSPCSN